MSRADHIAKRRQERLGHSWWWRRFADLVDRRTEHGVKRFSYDEAMEAMAKGMHKPIDPRRQPLRVKQVGAATPERLPRPPELTRQAHRRLYREACKLAGVPWRTERLFKTPRRERGRNWKDLTPEQLAEMEVKWAEYMQGSLKIE